MTTTDASRNQTIVLVRHGETEWSKSMRHTGNTDIGLTDFGKEMARAIAKHLSDQEFSLALSSPRSRAIETAKLAGFGDKIEIRSDLAEWDYGDYDGLKTVEIRAKRPDWNIWRDGFPNGESLSAVGARADHVIEEFDRTDGDVLVFGHGHQLRILTARWLGLAPSDAKLFFLQTGSISKLGYEREQKVMLSWNMTVSLD